MGILVSADERGTRRPAAVLTAKVVRVVTLVHLLLALAQPVTAGSYLAGDYDQRAVHALGADAVTSAGGVLLLSALVLAVLGGARWVAVGAAGLVLLETVQYLAGQDAALALHVPLGVGVVAGSIVLVVLVWWVPLDRSAGRTS